MTSWSAAAHSIRCRARHVSYRPCSCKMVWRLPMTVDTFPMDLATLSTATMST